MTERNQPRFRRPRAATPAPRSFGRAIAPLLLSAAVPLLGACGERSAPASPGDPAVPSAAAAAVGDDACRAAAGDAFTGALEYRKAVNRVRTSCTEAGCGAPLDDAESAYGALAVLHDAMASACGGEPPPGGVEVCDGVDNDGDGEVDEGFPYCVDGREAPNTDGATCDAGWHDVDGDPANGCETTGVVPGPGDLVINEIQFDPAGIPDSDGEWFELHNPGSEAVELQGSTIEGAFSFEIDRPLLVPAGGFVVLAANADPDVNGGVQADFDYGGLVIANDGPSDLIVRAPDGTMLVDLTSTFIELTREGFAQNLDPAFATAATNDNDGSWCEATTPYDPGSGNFGTPGAPNDPC